MGNHLRKTGGNRPCRTRRPTRTKRSDGIRNSTCANYRRGRSNRRRPLYPTKRQTTNRRATGRFSGGRNTRGPGCVGSTPSRDNGTIRYRHVMTTITYGANRRTTRRVGNTRWGMVGRRPNILLPGTAREGTTYVPLRSRPKCRGRRKRRVTTRHNVREQNKRNIMRSRQRGTRPFNGVRFYCAPNTKQRYQLLRLFHLLIRCGLGAVLL